MIQLENSNHAPKRKMSEMIADIAAGFVGVGNTMGERQNRLNAVCSAWNMACGTPEVRARNLEQYAKSYLQYNPANSPSDLADILKDMETLMNRKVQLFPEDQRLIVSARVVMVETDYQIEFASATLE